MSQKSPIVKILSRCHFCLSTLVFTTAQVMFITAKIMCMFFLSVNFCLFFYQIHEFDSYLLPSLQKYMTRVEKTFFRLFKFLLFISNIKMSFFILFLFFLIKEPRKKALNREQAELGKGSLLKLTMNKLIKL